ncbi:flagellar biosynthesis protein FlhB [Marinicauda algicola]|uniref:Flagellar biosynthetic protein FlhB n=1 Tax=Marinicauda algicola TaxID=2029849 RepID=A0A4S2GZC9_9PROT|nr:flagellar biosynthesis protein FlhB [Marinicauda algicola]TGY88301.1 flagellar biosynthesis protein FlhB [Marinicauda algicola]
MADEDKSEKTEQPTERKLRQAREKGDVAKSQEIPGWFILAAGLGIIAVVSPGLSRGMAESLSLFFANAHQLSLQPGEAIDLATATAMRIGLVVGLAFLALIVAAILGNVVQQGLLFTPSKLEPKLSKLNPVDGVKRLFGPQGWMNFLKGIGKMALVSIAIGVVLWPKRDELAVLPMMELPAVLGLLRVDAMLLMLAALIVYSLIAAADFFFQRHEFIERNKMSRKEIRDELKDTEGDPMVRAKLRQIRQERAQRRMMAKVPEAAVVITNPTHYAVALEYEQGRTPAPICIAKGVDAVALRIRELAEEHGIPIVEDPPLARALHATADLDVPIPVDHYKAVAKVIGYVLSVAKGRARGRK